jgi:serine phosphatase RsbU (regulator of sigma subunit)
MIDASEGRQGDVEPPAETRRQTDRIRERWPYRTTVAVLIVGLAVTGVLTAVSSREYTRNEKRLLTLRADDVGTALTSALPATETPLASATALANATGGLTAKFKRFVAPYVGQASGRPFASVSLWRLHDLRRGPIAVVGLSPTLGSSGVAATTFFTRAARSSKLSVTGLLSGPSPRLGFAFTGMASGPYAAYGESALPPSRFAPPQKNAAFNDLNYALYLGGAATPAKLLIASVRHLPLPTPRARVRIPFGDTSFLVSVTARKPLAGSLPQRLPWIIAIVGTLLTLGAAGLAQRLIQRRRATERLAAQLEASAEENRRLYREQRGIAQTLQHALLPASLPELPGLQISAHYESGAKGVEIGGDWYDLIELDDGRLLLVVGDVSGKGLPAAAAMAALRFAIHAYAAEGDDPATFLPKLSRLVSVYEDRHLATVLCAVIDVAGHEVSITSAGHLPPLMITNHDSAFVETQVGLPVGIDRAASYSSTTTTAPPGATLLAFTDGLVERRGETIEVGLERLRSEVRSNHAPLDQLLTRVVRDLRHDAPDDTAVAGIRWLS